MNDKAIHFIATAQNYQTDPPRLFTVAQKLALRDEKFPGRFATQEQKKLMDELVRLKLHVPESASTEEDRAKKAEAVREVVQNLRKTDGNEKKIGLFNALTELQPVTWDLGKNRQKLEWKVEDDIMSLWMLAFIGIVRDWGINHKEIMELVCFQLFSETTSQQVKNRAECLNEAYSTLARMTLIGADLFDIAS